VYSIVGDSAKENEEDSYDNKGRYALSIKIIIKFFNVASLCEESVDTFLIVTSEVQTSVVCHQSSIRQSQSPPQPKARMEQLVEPTECRLYQQPPGDIDLDQSSLEQSYCEQPSLLSYSSPDEGVQVRMYYFAVPTWYSFFCY